MGRSALVESLRDQAARDLQAVRDAARAEVERYGSELAAERERQQQRLEQAVAVEARQLEESAASEAARKARESTGRATVALADRLLALAREELPQLVAMERSRIFGTLADELPPYPWQCVRVSPADVELARTRFPDAVVEQDASITGGLDVSGEDGRVAVSNTLETRLEVAWPELLPRLIKEVARQDHGHGPAA